MKTLLLSMLVGIALNALTQDTSWYPPATVEVSVPLEAVQPNDGADFKVTLGGKAFLQEFGLEATKDSSWAIVYVKVSEDGSHLIIGLNPRNYEVPGGCEAIIYNGQFCCLSECEDACIRLPNKCECFDIN